eukprot:CAMPEP_0195512002 /NCGR_PEP_ID=MMETSP0794_2-20130614/4129_1 /TAXON_ID=515487 /ORGANISM="Stephanopyxis turris, Strain CCMP 815" /LENGTH=137 /DNA_ID=CAMNT_0040639715 /DNA_START=53 /DNA_END=466 /DNA_ORIENTATION=+
MIIPITTNDDNPPEWSLLELNGELILPSDPTVCNGQGDQRMELGAVRFTNDGTPVITVGSHELRGKIEKLQQPFVVMEKIFESTDTCENKDIKDHCEQQHHGEMNRDTEPGGGVQYHVAGVIRKKLLFDQYPKSIMR